MVAFMAHSDLDGALCGGVAFIVPESFKGPDPNQSITAHCRRRGRLRYRISDRAGAFGKYPCIGRAPLALHGGIITLSPFDVLNIFLFVHLAVKMEICNSDRSSSKSELLAVTTVASWLRAVSAISASF